MNEYVQMLNIIGTRKITQEEFFTFYKRIKTLKKNRVNDIKVKRFGDLIEGVLCNKISRFDLSYPLIKRFDLPMGEAVTDFVARELEYAKSGSDFFDHLIKLDKKVIPWYKQDPLTAPMFNYFFNIDASSSEFTSNLNGAARDFYTQLQTAKQELSDYKKQLQETEKSIASAQYVNIMGWVLMFISLMVMIASGFIGTVLFGIGLFLALSNNAPQELLNKKVHLLNQIKNNQQEHYVNCLIALLNIKEINADVSWATLSGRISELATELRKFHPTITYTEEEVVKLRSERIKMIKDHFKRELSFDDSKLLRAPTGISSPSWQDDLLTTIEPLLYQGNSEEVLKNSDHYTYMERANSKRSRIVNYNEVMFSTNSVQTIYLFDNKLGILNFVYDLISDQVIFDSYEEIYYRHISSVYTKSIVIENNFAKQFLITTTSGRNATVNFINKEDYILQAQLKTLEEQRKLLLPSKDESGTADDSLLDEFGLEAPSAEDASVQEALIDFEILRLKEKPFIKDIQGLELSRTSDNNRQIADNVVSMVTSAISSYLGKIQVSEIDRL